MNSFTANRPDKTTAASDDILTSWKSIANYLHRDVRTVMRWEHTRTLPVRRISGGAKAAIYALKSELDNWLKHKADLIPADSENAPKPIPSIAVLPFANLSADKDNEYFADGLADEILNLLARIPALQVTARTSSFLFRDETLDVRAIGAKLGAASLLGGSIQRLENRVRVSVQLVETQNGYHLWSDRFDREMNDAFALQEEIAGAVAEALRVKLAPQTSAASAFSHNAEAYNLWLKGRSYQYKNCSLDTLSKARECFERASVLDPTFAPAHLGLAEYYREISCLGLARPAEAAAVGMRSAQRAVELDKSSGEAHALLGLFLGAFNYDWQAAELQFKRALDLNPASAQVRSRHAMFFLVPLVRLAEAQTELEKALSLDPLSPDLHCQMTQVLMFQRKYADAEQKVRSALELDDQYPFAYWLCGVLHFLQQRYSESIPPIERAIQIYGPAPVAIAGRGALYAITGRADEARVLLGELEDIRRSTYISPVSIAWLNMFLGQIDSAFKWLDRAIEERDPQITHLAGKPLYDGLRSDPRFGALLKKMQLPVNLDSDRISKV